MLAGSQQLRFLISFFVVAVFFLLHLTVKRPCVF